MVIFKCYFTEEHIALSIIIKEQQRCEHRIKKNQQIKSTVHEINKLCVNKPRQDMKTKHLQKSLAKKALCKQTALDRAANSIK